VAVAERSPVAEAKAVPKPLPEGYVRLSEAAKRRSADPYQILRPYVGQEIVMTELTVSDDLKRGEMTFVPFENQDAPEVTAPVPAGALRAIIRAVEAHPESKIVFSVVQMKRGIALQ
jgi:hypothetical protein